MNTSTPRRAAIVTGAGRGLGRAYALDLARAGYSVLVNDLDVPAAKATAGACQALGADAIVDGSTIGSDLAPERIVHAATATFGRLDALVCNAGILRDRTIGNLTDDDVDQVLEVHLRGVLQLVRQAWPVFKDRRHGRIVLVSSAAGILGNVGQANYSAAKAAVTGLAKTLAAEGHRHGIAANVVAPIAQTQMAAAALDDMFAGMDPDQVAPLVTYLCAPDCAVSGEVFAAGGGTVTRLAWAESTGVRFGPGFTSDDVADRIKSLLDMSGCRFPANVTDHLRNHLHQGAVT